MTSELGNSRREGCTVGVDGKVGVDALGVCLDLSMYFKGGKEREGRGGWRCGFKTHLQYVIIAPGSEWLGGGGGGGHGRVTRA